MTVAPTPLHSRQLQGYRLLVLGALVLLVGIVVGVLLANLGSSSSSTTVRGSGVPASETRDVPAFTGVDLAGDTRVDIRVGGAQSVVVSADDNLVGRVTTAVRGDRLVIGTAGSFATRSPMTVEVTVPSLESLTLSGDGLVTAGGIRGERVSVLLGGSGLVRASGEVERLDVSLSGAGDAQLEQLVARRASATVSGSGRIVLNVTDSLEASVPGSGAIFYSGDPHVSRSVTGTGVIIGQ